MKVLLYGSTGMIGSALLKILEKDHQVVVAKTRLNANSNLEEEIRDINPTHILNCAGITGRPNVDQCEEIKEDVLETNVIGTARLGLIASKLNIHATHVSTGCIFEYDSQHPIPDESWDGRGEPGFRESDKPNFDKSFYSFSKIMTENILKNLNGNLILRLRMPITDDFNPRSFITKIIKYQKVCSILNSMSVLSDLLPLVPDMMMKKLTGPLNFVNPGVVSHNQILDLYQTFVDRNFTYQNFSLEEQSQILKAGRSNNALDCSRILELYPNLPHIQVSILNVIRKLAILNHETSSTSR